MALAITVFSLQAQGWNWPEKSKNLKVLPENTSAQDLAKTMKQFNNALGVRCTFCHVGEEGKDLETYDFVSDNISEKQSARVMMSMVEVINKQQLTKMSKRNVQVKEVSCVTCHHGLIEPTTLEDELMVAFTKKGLTGIAPKYKELRDKYYGGFAYDFSERSLASLAGRFANNKQYTEAIAVLNLNVENFPNSQISLFRIAQNFNSLNDKANVKSTLQKLLKINPDHEGGKAMMAELNK